MEIKKNVNNRNTIQRTLVIEAVRQLPHPTAEEVHSYIIRCHPTISRATVYRNLNLLAELGEILRVPTTDSADHFDMTPGRHYHAQCRKCGGIFDIEIDMGYIDGLQKEVKDSYGFQIEDQDLIFTGLCKKCQS